MIKFIGINKSGKVVTQKQKTHIYKDLPTKGLGKSFEKIGLYEPIIFFQNDAIDYNTWKYSAKNIEERAIELNSIIKWCELPLEKISDKIKYQLWFAKK